MSSESLIKIPVSDLVPVLEILANHGVSQSDIARLRKNSPLSKLVAGLVRGATPLDNYGNLLQVLSHDFISWQEIAGVLHHRGPYLAFEKRIWELPWDFITISKMDGETIFPLFSGLWNFQMLIEALEKESNVQLSLERLSLAESWLGDLFLATSEPYGYRAIFFKKIGASPGYKNSEELKIRIQEGIEEKDNYRLATFAEVVMFDIIYFLKHHSLSHRYPSYIILPQDSPQYPGALMALGMENGFYRVKVLENTCFEECAFSPDQFTRDERTGAISELKMSRPMIRKWDISSL